MRLALDQVDQGRQTGTDGRDAGEDEAVDVAEHERGLPPERVDHRPLEVDPPHREHHQQRSDDEQEQLGVEAVGVEGTRDRRRGRQDDLAEHDDREQLVALGDVVPVPRRGSRPLRPPRSDHLQHGQGHERDPAGRAVGQEDRPEHPQQLDEGHGSGVAQRRTTDLGVLARHPQPERDHRDTHDQVADDDDPEVVLGPRRARRPGGEDQDAGHHHEGEQPEDDVVGVVGTREPRVVHPRPPDREEHHGVAGDAREVALREVVVERRGHGSDGDHEAQVEEQLERCRRAVFLVGVPARHRPVPGDRGKTATHGVPVTIRRPRRARPPASAANARTPGECRPGPRCSARSRPRGP